MNQQNPSLRIPASQRLTVRRFSLSTLSTVLLQSLFINLQLQFTPVSTQTTCHQNGVTCTPLSGPGTAPPTCYGASLKFSHTAVLWVNDSSDSGSLSEVTSRLRLWEGLSSVPECWAVVQPFLCSVYIPRCDDSNGRLDYPSLELCERIREPCKLVKKFATDWPESLRCSKPYFKQNCGTGAYAQLTYNTTGRCDVPLVRTETEDSWWEGLEGCGVQCDDPLFTDEDHKHAHAFVTIMGGLCLASTLFTLFTFMIDWENASRYPALILFFVNFCFLLATVGWMAQFSNGARQDIVCRVDGTQRKAEPRLGSGETASCTVVFVMIYYFTMAGLLWFVMLCYAWHVTFRALGTPRDDLSSKTAYFHLVSWTIPLVLTIVCLAISEIDGDSLSGICFVGYNNHSVRAGFVLVPVACVLIVGLFFLVKGMWTLVGIKKDAPEFVGEKAASKITETIVRIAVFSVFALAIGLITFAIHIYIFIHQSQWKDSLDDYLYCLSNKTVSEAVGSTAGPASCTVQHRPSLVAMEINMFAFFAAGIIMSSWSWTKASLCNWEHFLRKVFRKPEKPVKVHRQRMVAQAYDRRQENDGRVSVSYHTTHDDPCDIASVMSRRLSQGSAHGSGQQFVYMERDNSSNNGSVVGGGGWRRRRRRKRRKKRNAVQPILGPVLSGIGFGPTKGGGVLRRGSESSVLSKASAQGIRMHVTENQAYRLNGSSSSVTGYDRIPTGGTASGSDIRGPHASRSRRRKLPRLAPLSKHRRRSFSSSRSSLNQFGMGLHGMNQMNQMNQSFHSQFQQNPYAQLYGGYDYSQFYASLGYPQMAYPFWPYPYQFPPQAPPPPGVPPHPQTPQPPPPRPPSSTGTPAATDFSAFSANLNSGGTLPAATSSPDSERKRLLTSSTSRRSEVTIETQQTEMISMQKLKTTTEFEPPREPLSDDSIEDLNSSQLEDSAEEAEINEDTGDTTGETTGEAEVGV